jgi:hypothetical protein
MKQLMALVLGVALVPVNRRRGTALNQVERLIHASGFANEPGITTGNLSACLVIKAVRSIAVTAAMAKL